MLKRIINGLEVEGTEKEWNDFDESVKEKMKNDNRVKYFLSPSGKSPEKEEYIYIQPMIVCTGMF